MVVNSKSSACWRSSVPWAGFARTRQTHWRIPPNEMSRELFDKYWGTLEALLIFPEAVTVVRAPAIALLRGVARAGYLGECRTSVSQDDPTMCHGCPEFREPACQETPYSMLARHPDPSIQKNGRDSVFSFCSMKCKMLGNTLV